MKKIVWLVPLVLTGTSLGVRVSENLKPIQNYDVCYIDVNVATVDDVKDSKLEALISKSIGDKNTLYGKVFDSKNSKNCTVYMVYTLDVMKNNVGQYFYHMSYQAIVNIIDVSGFFSTSGGGSEKDTRLKYVVIWDTARFGAENNYEKLTEIVTRSAGQMFEDFLLDWRNTH